VLSAYETQMMSMARYVSVAAPLYLVLGRLLAQLPLAAQAAGVALGGLFLSGYASLFAVGCWML
jgi:hypothetical protein